MKTANNREEPSVGCGILGKYPVISVLAFALIGIGVGVVLSFWDPEDSDGQETKSATLQWLGLLGDLFIRALEAVVLPLVFVNVVLSVVEMMSIGRTSSVAGVTILLYFMTTVIASIVGLFSILCFQNFFVEGEFEDRDPDYITLSCQREGYYLTEANDGSITCADDSSGNMQFIIDDISNTFVKASEGTRDDISLRDTFYNGIFTKIITSNIFQSFVEGNFAAVVFFAIIFGIALGRVLFVQKKLDNHEDSHLVLFLKEVDAVLITIINWIITLTPFAVLSLIVKAIGSQNDLAAAFSSVGSLMAATIMAMVVHFIIVDIGLLAVFTGSNPFTYLKHLIPAQTTALLVHQVPPPFR